MRFSYMYNVKPGCFVRAYTTLCFHSTYTAYFLYTMCLCRCICVSYRLYDFGWHDYRWLLAAALSVFPLFSLEIVLSLICCFHYIQNNQHRSCWWNQRTKVVFFRTEAVTTIEQKIFTVKTLTKSSKNQHSKRHSKGTSVATVATVASTITDVITNACTRTQFVESNNDKQNKQKCRLSETIWTQDEKEWERNNRSHQLPTAFCSSFLVRTSYLVLIES